VKEMDVPRIHNYSLSDYFHLKKIIKKREVQIDCLYNSCRLLSRGFEAPSKGRGCWMQPSRGNSSGNRIGEEGCHGCYLANS